MGKSSKKSVTQRYFKAKLQLNKYYENRRAIKINITKTDRQTEKSQTKAPRPIAPKLSNTPLGHALIMTTADTTPPRKKIVRMRGPQHNKKMKLVSMCGPNHKKIRHHCQTFILRLPRAGDHSRSIEHVEKSAHA